jgi:homoserine dehydrogenase
MTREILLIQLGLGGVGQALARQVLAQHNVLTTRDDIRLNYLALVDSSGALHRDEPLAGDMVAAAVNAKQHGQKLAELEHGYVIGNWCDLLPDQPCIVVDVTAADGMEDGLMHAVVSGHRVVLANKRPLTGNLDFFTALTRTRAARYEATVGAGLPIVSTLQTLLDTGDDIARIEASMSGTLGYLCTAIEEGLPLSHAVRMARQSGWTEPDPRDDLSGADVARKALILARTCGLPWNTTHVPGTPWFPSELAAIGLDEFMERVSELDSMYMEKVAQAHERSAVLRYVATIEPDAASIELRELPEQHPLAALRGTDNLFSFTTTRYAEQPLVVRGPGAGVDVTAAGVLGDIIATAREL